MAVIERDVAFEAEDIFENGNFGEQESGGRVTVWADALIRHNKVGEPRLTKEELDTMVAKMKKTRKA